MPQDDLASLPIPESGSFKHIVKFTMTISLLLGLGQALAQIIDQRIRIFSQPISTAAYDVGSYFVSRLLVASCVGIFFAMLIYTVKSVAHGPRFSIRTLLILITLIAIILGGSVAGVRSVRKKFGHGVIRSSENWPRAFSSLVADKPGLTSGVTLYGLGQFMDHKSIWRIEDNPELIARLLKEHNCNLTNDQHPKAKELRRSLRYSWPRPEAGTGQWLATPGYGSQHIEGLDLFLIWTDADSKNAYVLHEWIF